MAKKRKGPTPEQRADWAEARRRMEEVLRKYEARTEELRELEQRRRRRLQRLSLRSARPLRRSL